MRRLLLLTVLVIMLGVTGTSPLRAGAGSHNDSTGEAGEAAIDIQQVRHNNSGSPENITYQMDAVSPWATGNFGTAQWNLDFDDDAAAEACVRVAVESGDYVGRFFAPCETQTSTVVTADVSGDVLTVTFSRSAFNDVTEASGDTSYTYAVEVVSQEPSGNDLAPDDGTPTITHDLSSTSTPTPTATATPATTPTPTPTPTPAATPTPAGGASETTSLGTIDDSTVVPGQAVRISGSGFAPSAPLTYAFDATTLGSTSASGTGTYSIATRVPTQVLPGVHEFRVTGPGPQGQAHTSIIRVTVIAAALPATGSFGERLPAAPFVGAGVLAAILILVVADRRRLRPE